MLNHCRIWANVLLCLCLCACSKGDPAEDNEGAESPTDPAGQGDEGEGAADPALTCPAPERPPTLDTYTRDNAPATLGETGLYSDIASGTLEAGVEAYRPLHELWADGGTKRRWLRLPAGERIDTSDMDNWRFPVGTRAWKEMSRDGQRIETRLLWKKDNDRWVRAAYQWNEAQSEAELVLEHRSDAHSSGHDIPSVEGCRSCHEGIADTLAGVSAIQLDHDEDGLNLSRLDSAGLLSDSPEGRFSIPGDATAQAALGYLHTNCGNCHNPSTVNPNWITVELALQSDALQTVADTAVYRTAVGVEKGNSRPVSGLNSETLIAAGDPGQSLVYLRMQRTCAEGAMPPLGVEVTDVEGVAAVGAWIESL